MLLCFPVFLCLFFCFSFCGYPLLCLVSSSLVFRSCGFFFCLLMSLLLLFLFRLSAFVLCGFCLCRSGLVASSIFFYVFFCLIVFFSLLLSLLLSVFCILLCLSIFCLLLSLSIVFYIRLNNSAIIFYCNKKKNGGSFTAISFNLLSLEDFNTSIICKNVSSFKVHISSECFKIEIVSKSFGGCFPEVLFHLHIVPLHLPCRYIQNRKCIRHRYTFQ